MKITKIEMGIYGLKGKFRNPVFSELPFVVPVTPVVGTPTRVAGLDGWPDHLAPRKITYEVTLLESALELCRGGFAVAYLPKFVVRLHNQTVSPRKQLERLSTKQEASIAPQDVYLIKRKSDAEGANAKKLARIIREVCNTN